MQRGARAGEPFAGVSWCLPGVVVAGAPRCGEARPPGALCLELLPGCPPRLFPDPPGFLGLGLLALDLSNCYASSLLGAFSPVFMADSLASELFLQAAHAFHQSLRNILTKTGAGQTCAAAWSSDRKLSMAIQGKAF